MLCKDCYYFNEQDACTAVIVGKDPIVYKETGPDDSCELWQTKNPEDCETALLLALAYIDYIKQENIVLHNEANGSLWDARYSTTEDYIRGRLDELRRPLKNNHLEDKI